MYFVELFEVPALPDDRVAPLLERALDADVAAGERVVAMHALRGAPLARRQAIARSLVAVLNEQTNWLASEALLCIHALAPELGIGVRDALLVASSVDDADDFIDDGTGQPHCPSLGPVAFPREVAALLPRLPPTLPWLQHRPPTWVTVIDGARFVGSRPTTIKLGGNAELMPRADDWMLIVERGEAHVNGVRVAPPVNTARVVAGGVVTVGARRAQIVRIDLGHELVRGGGVTVVVDDAVHRWAPIGGAVAIVDAGPDGTGAVGCHFASLGGGEVAVVGAGFAVRAPLPTLTGGALVDDGALSVGPYRLVPTATPDECRLLTTPAPATVLAMPPSS